MAKKDDTIRLESLPPMKISWWCRACCHLFGFLVEKILKLLRFRAGKKLSRILDGLKEDRNILGKPRYIIDGNNYEVLSRNGKSVTPDYVEIYIQNGCRIDMLYLDGERLKILASRSISQWDAVCSELNMKKKSRYTTQTLVIPEQQLSDNRAISKKTLSEFLTSNNLNSTLPEHWCDEIYHFCHYLGKSGDFEKIQEAAEHWVDEIYHYLDESSEYETIQDLYSALRRSDKAYRCYLREMQPMTGLAQFSVRLSLVDVNFRNWAFGKLLSSIELQIIQKYGAECL